MAREIHDSLLQGFGGIALELHAASARLALPPERQALLDRVLTLIDRTLTQARDVVWDIRKPGTAAAPLVDACREAAGRILGGTTASFTITSRGRAASLPATTQTECLRIVEEALANARRHATATRVEVELDFRWQELLVTVRDDGSGFDPEARARERGHWGLLGMRERASRIGGHLVVTSQPGHGTTILVAVPCRRTRLRRVRKD